MDARREERNAAFKEKDERIRELYDRLITDGIESREALATAAKTLEQFVDKQHSLETNQRAILEALARLENERQDAA